MRREPAQNRERGTAARALEILLRDGPGVFIRKCAERMGLRRLPDPEREDFLVLRVESSGPDRRQKPQERVRFSVPIDGPDASRLEIVCSNPRRDPGARIALEVLSGGRVMASTAAGLPAGRSWIALDFPAVRVPPDGVLSFALKAEGDGAGILAAEGGRDGGGLQYRVLARDKQAIYRKWIEVNERDPSGSPGAESSVHIGVVTDADAEEAEALLHSLQAQEGGVRWELLARDAASSQKRGMRVPEHEERRFDLIVLAEAGIQLASGALNQLARVAAADPEADFFYGDADRRSADGTRSDPFFRPDFSPHYLLSYNWLYGLCAVRPELFDEAKDHRTLDAAFLAAVKARRVRHVPAVLHHDRRNGRAAAPDTSVVREALREKGIEADVAPGRLPGFTEIRYRLPARSPFVSIIIPNHNQPATLEVCVRSVLNRTKYPEFEILIAENNSTDPDMERVYRELCADPRVRVERFDGPFNYAAVNNRAVSLARGQYLLFLNNDTEVLTDDWLERMTALAAQPDVGAVGAKLLYPDGTVQHGGAAARLLGIAGHMHLGMSGDHEGYFGRLKVPAEVSAVTGACLMVPRRVFEALHGFDEQFGLALNDVDLCLRIRETGRSVLLEPRSVLTHFESKTRGYETTPEQLARFKAEQELWLRKWEEKYPYDPYYSPNFRYDTCVFDVAPEVTGRSAARVAAAYERNRRLVSEAHLS